MKHKTLSIIIPCFNEEKTIEQLLQNLVNTDLSPLQPEIIIINDSSTDKSANLIESFKHKNNKSNIKLISHIKNKGKSQAVKTGILSSRGDLVIIQDADLEYNPQNIKQFVKMFIDNPELDFIYGNRYGKKNKVIYIHNWLGNKVLTAFSNFFTYPRGGVKVGDMEVCYKMIRGDLIREIAPKLKSKSNFGFEPEITAKLSKIKPKPNYSQIAIDYVPRTFAEGKHMKSFRDGLKACIEIIRFNLISG